MRLDISTQTASGIPIGVTINASSFTDALTTVNHIAGKAIRHGMAPGSVRVKVWLVPTSKSVTLGIPNDFRKVETLVRHAWALLAR